MFFSSDRIMLPNDIWRDFCSYMQSNSVSQMSVEEEGSFTAFTKKYCEICKRDLTDLQESLFNRIQLVRDNRQCNMAQYRDFLKQNPNYKMFCLESAVLIKDALDSSNIKNSVIIVLGNRKSDHQRASYIFNVYWYREEMFVCDLNGSTPYIYNGYLSSVIPFKEYIYTLTLIYDDIKLFRDEDCNFWNLTFDMKIDNLDGFSEIKMTISK